MNDLNLVFALVSFYFVMYVTPGPNNAMVLTSGLKFGFFKTIPHISGITIGHVLQLGNKSSNSRINLVHNAYNHGISF